MLLLLLLLLLPRFTEIPVFNIISVDPYQTRLGLHYLRMSLLVDAHIWVNMLIATESFCLLLLLIIINVYSQSLLFY